MDNLLEVQVMGPPSMHHRRLPTQGARDDEHHPHSAGPRTKSVNFEPNDNVWLHLSALENIWKQRIVIHNVVGVPDSFIFEINGQQYQQNKHDLTFSPPRGDGEGDDGVVDAQEQDGTKNKTDRL